jgi:hypothetical protein
MDLTPTTELEAVNLMLAAIGESPVNTVLGNGLPDANNAHRQLQVASRAVQTKGWHWNTDEEFKLVRDFPSNEITVPPNTLRLDTVYPDQDVDVVLRYQRLYDRVNHTYIFDKDLTVDIVQFLPFEELPEPARQYIVATAARKFCETTVGSADLSKFTQADQRAAWTLLLEDECESSDANVLTNLQGLQR